MSLQHPISEQTQALARHETRDFSLDREQNRSVLDHTQRALLNILEDLTEEKSGFEAGHRAVLNILEDSQAEKAGLEGAQRAVLNILEDAEAEKANLEGAQRAVLNILEDSEAEKANLEGAQRAALNILEDFDAERSKVETINSLLQEQIEERKRAENEIRNLNKQLERRVVQRTAALAALEASNKELEAFSYSVSHDLRAPLRHMDGFLALLVKASQQRLDEKSRRYLDKVTAASRTMTTLIDDLLQFSRIGRNEIRTAAVNLGPLVEDVRRELEPETRDRAVTWQVSRLPEIYGDPAMLRLVLTNLLSNALKYTRTRPEGRIQVGSMAGEPDEDVIFVRDNGVGFDMKYADKLFKVFQRLHQSDQFEGTGIGLANVRRIIERHGGRVWAESTLGVGASFYFSLPRNQNQESFSHERTEAHLTSGG
jgi:signal transduction histidine kinase